MFLSINKAADRKLASLECGNRGFALNRACVCYGWRLNAKAAGMLHNGQRERMARGIFDGGRNPQEF